MADSLFLNGANKITKHTGTEMAHVPGKSGASSRFPKWWNQGGTVQYVDCIILRVNIGANQLVRLVVPVTKETRVMIHHDGEGGFTFTGFRYVERAAVFPENLCGAADLITEYQFPKISGGAVLTRTVGTLPSAPKKVELKAPKKVDKTFQVKVNTKPAEE